MTLLINTCVRSESRTLRIARALVAKLGEDYEELCLPKEDIRPLDEKTLAKRDALIEKGDYSDPMFRYARQLAAADRVVVAAPYWDLSFPSLLKIYIENVYVIGLTTRMSPEGLPIGMCSADKMYYVTTSGGPHMPDFGYAYIKSVLCDCFGIKESRLIKAEMLDIVGNDPESIVNETIKMIEADETIC